MQEMQETLVWSLGQKDPLREKMATLSSIIAWRISWTEESGGLQSTVTQRVGHDCLSMHACIPQWEVFRKSSRRWQHLLPCDWINPWSYSPKKVRAGYPCKVGACLVHSGCLVNIAWLRNVWMANNNLCVNNILVPLKCVCIISLFTLHSTSVKRQGF